MIKFLGRIRRKLLYEKTFGKYLIYAAGEIILVVFGILIALQINNWNEANKNILEGQKVLHEIRNNLVSGVSSMDNSLSMDTAQLESSLLILDYLSNNKPYTSELGRAFMGFPFGRVYPIPKTGYSFLQSKGAGLIQSDSLRVRISNLYDTTYPDLMYIEENDVNVRRNELLKSELYEHFILTAKEFGDSTQMRLPIDYNALLSDNRFESMVRSITNNRRWFMNIKMETKNEMENLIVEIEKELRKKH